MKTATKLCIFLLALGVFVTLVNGTKPKAKGSSSDPEDSDHFSDSEGEDGEEEEPDTDAEMTPTPKVQSNAKKPGMRPPQRSVPLRSAPQRSSGGSLSDSETLMKRSPRRESLGSSADIPALINSKPKRDVKPKPPIVQAQPTRQFMTPIDPLVGRTDDFDSDSDEEMENARIVQSIKAKKQRQSKSKIPPGVVTITSIDSSSEGSSRGASKGKQLAGKRPNLKCRPFEAPAPKVPIMRTAYMDKMNEIITNFVTRGHATEHKTGRAVPLDKVDSERDELDIKETGTEIQEIVKILAERQKKPTTPTLNHHINGHCNSCIVDEILEININLATHKKKAGVSKLIENMNTAVGTAFSLFIDQPDSHQSDEMKKYTIPKDISDLLVDVCNIHEYLEVLNMYVNNHFCDHERCSAEVLKEISIHAKLATDFLNLMNVTNELKPEEIMYLKEFMDTVYHNIWKTFDEQVSHYLKLTCSSARCNFKANDVEVIVITAEHYVSENSYEVKEGMKGKHVPLQNNGRYQKLHNKLTNIRNYAKIPKQGDLYNRLSEVVKYLQYMF